MGMLRDLLTGRFRAPVAEQFAYDPTQAIGPLDVDPAVFGFQTYVDYIAPVAPITRLEALSVPAVYAARNMICSTISTLPLEVHDKQRREIDSPFLAQIDPRVARSVTIAYTIEDLLFEGRAWWRITRFGWDGFPAEAQRVENWRVTVDERTKEVRVDDKRVPDSELIRFESPNPALLVHAARAIRKCLKLDVTSDMYADNPRALGYFTPAEGADPTETEVADFLAAYRAARRTGADAYIGSALKYQEAAGLITPADLELAAARQHAVLEIARATGIDPEDLGVSTTSRTYQNAVDRRQEFVNQALAPYLTCVAERLSMPDVTPRGKYVVWDLDDFLKADPKTRWDTYAVAHGIGGMTLDEVREAEDRPALPKTTPGPAQRPATPPVPASTNPPEGVNAMATQTATFSRETGLSFDVPEVDAAFQVDEHARTITGLAVPWGQVARNGGRKFMFAENSLRWREAGRVKMLVDHDNSQPIGKAVKLSNTPDGLLVTFRVARGPEGDRALALAADGVRDGLSVGIDYEDDGYAAHPDHPGVVLVTKAALREVTLTAMPAYDDARVTSVRAHNERETTMTVAPEQTAPGAPAAPDLGALSAAITEGFSAAVTRLGELPAREIVPAGVAVGDGVRREEPLYRLDAQGNMRTGGKFDFSADVIAGAQGDREAEARALSFMRAAFDVDTTDATALTPNRQRPDLYVDQREFRYPLWEAVNRGSLEDNTPFVLPKFNTSSGLVANHTEGVEPTPGAFTATSQTITPQAVSGKVEITRELWDRGGNPQLSSILWRQMTRSYYEALEAYVVSVLDAATPTGITLPVAAVNGALDAAVTSALASLQFVRGGFRFDQMALQIDLYKALAGAVDTAGRHLFPMYGPANAIGTAAPLWSSLNVGGIKGYPSWALAATGTVAASSYLFDREAVNFWATPPRQLKFEYRVAYVDLAIWGYKAGAITDLNGVRELIYDPS